MLSIESERDGILKKKSSCFKRKKEKKKKRSSMCDFKALRIKENCKAGLFTFGKNKHAAGFGDGIE